MHLQGSGEDEIVVCAWDGMTYIVDQGRNVVRYQFEENVSAFCAGESLFALMKVYKCEGSLFHDSHCVLKYVDMSRKCQMCRKYVQKLICKTVHVAEILQFQPWRKLAPWHINKHCNGNAK